MLSTLYSFIVCADFQFVFLEKFFSTSLVPIVKTQN